MPADEVTHGTDVDTSRGRTGPRHAAPRKPLFTRFHVPAGKAIALAAMPTAVLMGMGFTPTLANADDQPASNSQQAEEYKACVAAMEDDASTSTSQTPSASDSTNTSDEDSDEAKPTPSATAGDSASGDDDSASGSDGSSSSDSGSDDEATPTPAPSASTPVSSGATGGDSAGDSDKATPTPSASASAPEEKSPNLLETIGDAITGIFTGGDEDSSSDKTATESEESKATDDSAAADTPAPTASPTPSPKTADKDTAAKDTAAKDTDKTTTTVKNSAAKVTEVLKDTTEKASKAAEGTPEAAEDTSTAKDATKAAEAVTASPSASASATPDPDDCPAATDDQGGVDNTIRLPDDPWTLNASSLLLKGADYQGIVKVRTAGGTVKEVLKYVISGGTDIGDLHQTVKDSLAGKTYHVQAAKGSTSTITDGKTIMYTESISGNLFGLIPITFDPMNPPPLNIPLIYFTNVKVTQAGQFGGTLTVPGLHQYTT
ncbi:hypothetical protein PV396_35525 [Streptomyces sp. ME02-8801-2C]|uniref:hypothetical protein n=1 Tax=Streptomyces sp. ME02-8801-2C TaxID=3028680 RepID=UPI0029A14906|nr:hypothetical protein [Streptomyces sp. ME02-8801-2C]MDX3457208.1 hypothetical protein [Streptomyces sp. ME02-8801-2C]